MDETNNNLNEKTPEVNSPNVNVQEDNIQTEQPIEETPKPTSSVDQDLNKEIAALSYIWILSVPIFLFRKDSPYIQKHAKQGIYLFGGSVIAWFIATLNYIWWLGLLFLILYMVLIIRGALKAMNGEDYYIPFLTDILSGDNKTVAPTATTEETIIKPAEIDEDTKQVIEEQKYEEKEALEEIQDKVQDVLENTEGNK